MPVHLPPSNYIDFFDFSFASQPETQAISVSYVPFSPLSAHFAPPSPLWPVVGACVVVFGRWRVVRPGPNFAISPQKPDFGLDRLTGALYCWRETNSEAPADVKMSATKKPPATASPNRKIADALAWHICQDVSGGSVSSARAGSRYQAPGLSAKVLADKIYRVIEEEGDWDYWDWRKGHADYGKNKWIGASKRPSGMKIKAPPKLPKGLKIHKLVLQRIVWGVVNDVIGQFGGDCVTLLEKISNFLMSGAWESLNGHVWISLGRDHGEAVEGGIERENRKHPACLDNGGRDRDKMRAHNKRVRAVAQKYNPGMNIPDPGDEPYDWSLYYV